MTAIQKISAQQATKLKRPAFEEMPLYRIQVALTTSTGGDAGTDDAVYVMMNNSDYRFYLDRGIDDFQQGKTVLYDVLFKKVKKVKDIQYLLFGLKGNDGVCFKKAELYLNGYATPVFSRTFNGRGTCFDNDDSHLPTQLVISGTELRSGQSWKNAMADESIWLPMKEIPKDMIVSLVEAVIGNQIQQQNGSIVWGDTGGINTIWGDAVEVSYVNESTLHFDLDCQLQITGPNPEVDVDFDLKFTCKDGMIQTEVLNVKTGTNLVGDLLKLVTTKLPDLIGKAIGSYIPVVGAPAGKYISGLLADYLSFSLNFAIDNPNLSQSCKLIKVTPQCNIVLYP
jgi:hypothetical protein